MAAPGQRHQPPTPPGGAGPARGAKRRHRPLGGQGPSRTGFLPRPRPDAASARRRLGPTRPGAARSWWWPTTARGRGPPPGGSQAATSRGGRVRGAEGRLGPCRRPAPRGGLGDARGDPRPRQRGEAAARRRGEAAARRRGEAARALRARRPKLGEMTDASHEPPGSGPPDRAPRIGPPGSGSGAGRAGRHGPLPRARAADRVREPARARSAARSSGARTAPASLRATRPSSG